ncbi:lytic murein transglycosylase [Methylobacterium sp. 4-46]|uniref:lytic murein transglycosylase n=1 Tax=unclassified Methylobacterium TaxID=2615210 RepID=UPI000165C89D|nr:MULTISPECIES: lytic murein transglycosylase [Methylobacterium]ACA16293.1 lytic murein transglycosylase [Methylobacterium sp. 4-46]WFT82002.1 lytic murein transglycosylase [Methylobacterium nodulans]
MRRALPAALALLLGLAAARAEDGFRGFIEGLRPLATARGVARETFDAAFREVTAPDPAVLARLRRQGEFSRPVWEYLAGSVSTARVARGRAEAARRAELLAGLEARYGVPGPVLLAVWGMESDFGTGTGSVPTVRALATLAQAGHRGDLFRDELLAALDILQHHDVGPEGLKGSWAGAMGQTQFLPSVYLRAAVDFDGDGRRDIWNSAPDALASIANFLRQAGWQPGLPWGLEVRLPAGFDLSRHRGSLAEFAARGVARADGAALPAAGEASLFLPGGLGGPAFLITVNFEAFRAYNTSDAYALAVGHLADRIAGGGPLAAPWPIRAPRLDAAGLAALQRGLAARDLYAGPLDGRAGPKLREAVRRYQTAAGLPADGYATPALLDHLRRAP